MRFYGLDAQGIFQIQSVSTLPAWTSDDERRWVYAEDTETCHYGTSTSWETFSSKDVVYTGLAGYVSRPKFIYVNIFDIKVDAGAYHHAGTIEQFVYWNSQLILEGGPFLINPYSWKYLYIDNSAIVASGSNLLTSSEFLFTSTPPAWVDSKHGWYNGLDRCIFAVYLNAMSRVTEFFHEGDFVRFADQITEYNSTISTVWVDIVLTKPSFTRMVETTFATFSGNNRTVYWRTNDQSGFTGHWVFGTSTSGRRGSIALPTYCDSNARIEIKANNSIGVQVYNNGWYFPTGM